MNKENLEVGKIYFIAYGENTSLIGMIKSIDSMRIDYFFQFHYWNGFENYHRNTYSITSGITEIREASKSEKHNLFKEALSKGDI